MSVLWSIAIGFLLGVGTTLIFLAYYLGFIRLPFVDDSHYDY